MNCNLKHFIYFYFFIFLLKTLYIIYFHFQICVLFIFGFYEFYIHSKINDYALFRFIIQIPTVNIFSQ